MKHGFIKVAAVTPKIKVADTAYNVGQISLGLKEAAEAGAKIIVFPELCITGYTCGDLFLQELLLRKAKEGLLGVAEQTKEVDALVFVGLPLVRDNKLYNVAACIKGRFSGLCQRLIFLHTRNFMRAGILRKGTVRRWNILWEPGKGKKRYLSEQTCCLK